MRLKEIVKASCHSYENLSMFFIIFINLFTHKLELGAPLRIAWVTDFGLKFRSETNFQNI